MTLYRGTLTRLIRMRNTHDGGPRWKIHFTVESGVLTIELATKPDSTLASEITPDWQGRYVEAEIENATLLKVTEIPPTREQEFRAAFDVLNDARSKARKAFVFDLIELLEDAGLDVLDEDDNDAEEIRIAHGGRVFTLAVQGGEVR